MMDDAISEFNLVTPVLPDSVATEAMIGRAVTQHVWGPGFSSRRRICGNRGHDRATRCDLRAAITGWRDFTLTSDWLSWREAHSAPLNDSMHFLLVILFGSSIQH